MKNKISLLLYIILISLAISVTAYAWLVNSLHTNPTFTGVVHKSYFESGDGTSSAQYIDGLHTTDTGCAFEIKYPVQLYYFAWLQALGYFNQPGENNSIDQVYFYLSSDLDMTGWTLPQIGTQTYPFVGNFDGNGHTITGLTVQNVNTIDNNSWSDKPDQQISGLNIIGFFGVVGTLGNTNTTTAAILNNNGFVATSGYSYSSQVNSISNLNLEDIVVKTDLSSSLIGLAAGYVNGTLENIRLVGGTIVNCSATTALSEYTTDLSEFSAVGFCTDAYKSTSTNTTIIQQDPVVVIDDGSGSLPGQGNNWGGSIDIKTLNINLHNAFITNGLSSSTTMGSHSLNDAKFNMTRSATGNPTTTSVIYRWRTNTAVRLISDNSFNISNANTGYITGSTIGTGVNGSPKSSSYYIDYICYSLNNQSATATKIRNHTQASYNPNTLEVVTRSGNAWVRITDSYNQNNTSVNSAISGYARKTVEELGFVKYNQSRASLNELFLKADGTTSETYVHGIHFDTNAVSTSTTMTLASAKILGQTYSNYQMPIGCIDFRVRDAGRINMFAGSYYNLTSNTGTSSQLTSSNLNDSFFSLHHIFRDANQNLTGSKEISVIYTNTDASTNTDLPYVYKYTDNTYSTGSAGTMLFDMQYLWGAAPVVLTLYYFEIPVNPGEYALGAVKQGNTIKSKGAYLLYLDISANATFTDKVTTTEVKETYIETLNYPNGVAFVDTFSSTEFETNSSLDPKKSVFLSLPISNSSGEISYEMTESNGIYTLTVTNTSSSLSGYMPKCLPLDKHLLVNGIEDYTFTGTYILEEKVTEVVNFSDGTSSTTITTTTTTIINNGTPVVITTVENY